MTTSSVLDTDDSVRHPCLKTEDEEKRVEQRTPPRNGICRRCGKNRPINRLMLCYHCWVKTNLEDKNGWREGIPHPADCGCIGLGEHASRDGTSRGLN